MRQSKYRQSGDPCSPLRPPSLSACEVILISPSLPLIFNPTEPSGSPCAYMSEVKVLINASDEEEIRIATLKGAFSSTTTLSLFTTKKLKAIYIKPKSLKSIRVCKQLLLITVWSVMASCPWQNYQET